MEWDQIVAIADSRGGIVLLVLAILWTGSRRVWVWGFVLDRERERGDEWKDIATGVIPLAERAVDKLERRSEPRG
jgi:hypothetical protein